jgi:hypothetical protein
MPNSWYVYFPGGGLEPTLLRYPGDAMDIYPKVLILHIP